MAAEIVDPIIGRFLDAVRGSSTAARSIGINPDRQRLVVFVAGSAVAGFGGGLIASFTGQANYAQSFTFFLSLVWVVLVITAGARLVLWDTPGFGDSARLLRRLPSAPVKNTSERARM